MLYVIYLLIELGILLVIIVVVVLNVFFNGVGVSVEDVKCVVSMVDY